MTRWHVALLAAGLAGCALQGGAHAGYAMHARRGVPDQWTWGGHAQGQLGHEILPPVHVAIEAEGHSEERQGSLVTWGLQLGVNLPVIPRRVSLLGHFDGGWPLGWSNPVSGNYLGFSLELPIATDDPGSPSKINRDLRFIDQEGAVVPYVRLRALQLEVRGAPQGSTYEAVVGVAFRTTLVTDLL